MKRKQPHTSSTVETILPGKVQPIFPRVTKKPKILSSQAQGISKERNIKPSSSQFPIRPFTGNQRNEALAKQSLCLCLANSCDSLHYVRLIRANILFDQPSQFKFQFQRIHIPPSVDKGCFLRMSWAISGSNLYVLGGEKINEESSDYSSGGDSSDTTAVESSDYSSRSKGDDNYSSKVFTLNLAKPEIHFGADAGEKMMADAGEMLSKMASPFIIPVDEKLLVLAGPPLSFLPDCPFEIHDPSNKKEPWKKLDRPPFLKPYSKYFQDPQVRSYVVIDNKIHLSTSSFSFTFDIGPTDGKWTPCYLFEDPLKKVQRCIDIQYPTEFGWANYPAISNEDEEVSCGRPFEFEGRAVMLDNDVMICLAMFPFREVVAYKFIHNKAPKRQPLLEIPSDATSAYLADFKNGDLCLLTFFNDYEKQDCQISITPFEVLGVLNESSQKDGEIGTFLDFVCRPKINLPLRDCLTPAEQLSPSKSWSLIGSFVVDVES